MSVNVFCAHECGVPNFASLHKPLNSTFVPKVWAPQLCVHISKGRASRGGTIGIRVSEAQKEDIVLDERLPVLG